MTQGLNNNKAKISDDGRIYGDRVLVDTPTGLFCYASNYTTGSGLLATPASVACNLTESVDISDKWAVNSPANGEITYSGDTRYFQIHCDITCLTASGGTPSTIALDLQKQVGAGGWVNISGSEVDRYLSSTADTGSVSLGAVVSMSSGDDLRLLISSSSNIPTYTLSHINFLINSFI